jgi:HK97 gp10 family phage protein
MRGKNAHINRLKKLSGPTMDLLIGRALFAGGEAIQVEAQISITTGSASGTKTKKHRHVASRPGEPPNNFTGTLANNIETVQISERLVEVSSNAPYSRALEEGTSRMAARPFMGPARDAKRDEVVRLVEEAKRVAIRASRSKD